MNLYSLLAKHAPNRVFFSILIGIQSGAAFALLIPLVMSSMDARGEFEDLKWPRFAILGIQITNPSAALLFAAALVFVWLSRTWVDVTMTRVSLAATSALRLQTYHRIAYAPLAVIEEIGFSRIATTIATDMPAVVVGAQTAQTVLIDLVTLVGMLSFLAIVNLGVFWFLLKCIIFGVFSYLLTMSFADRYFFRASILNDKLQKSVHGLLHGFKELKLSDEKRRQYFDGILQENENQLLAAQRPGSTLHSAVANYGLMLNFLFLGLVTFVFVSYHSLSAQGLSSVIMVMLYISMPIGSITSSISRLTVARLAIRRVNALLADLPQEEVLQQRGRAHVWNSVRFDEVSYQYKNKNDGAGFTVGPVNLEFFKGEVAFIVGGNGSGKSTLCKLLTLHYHAAGGAIYFGADRITSQNINSYRQSISAIYADYYLFDRILATNQDYEKVRNYLTQFGLDKKVRYSDGRFSTLSLSDGQRRRLALVAAFMEDRDLYVFDEWAADQDPHFKEVFYRQILLSLKARGKAVVVISHDDRYFDVADRVIEMREGKCIERPKIAVRVSPLS
jgi:putative ATP-binding cassette transporter